MASASSSSIEPSSQSRMEASLRKRIQDPKRPKDARDLVELAILLSERFKNEKHKPELLQEAMELANEAIRVQPTIPNGYAALATITPNVKDKIAAIHKALPLCGGENERHYWRMKLELSIRLFLMKPPRTPTTAAADTKQSMVAPSQPRRHDLTAKEMQLYLDILQLLKTAPTHEEGAATFVGNHHYYIGTFFRKMEPPHVNQPRSIFHLSRAVQLLPESHANQTRAQFWLATLADSSSSSDSTTRIPIPTKIPPHYIVDLYSSCSERFDDLLVNKLSYQTPTLLRALLNKVVGIGVDDGSNKNKKNKGNYLYDKAADLGCGTGLSGLAFRDLCHTLIGVDLSPEMIAKAQQRNIYDQLIIGDLTTTTLLPPNTSTTTMKKEWLDLVISCDVFCYLGDLTQVMQHVRKSLHPGGLFVFSTELLSNDNNNNTSHQPYKLQPCARFAHRQEYVLDLANKHHFKVMGQEICVLRKNRGKNVMGLLIVLCKA